MGVASNKTVIYTCARQVGSVVGVASYKIVSRTRVVGNVVGVSGGCG